MTARIFPIQLAHLTFWAGSFGLSVPLSALAHVELDSPNGGEQLVAGSVFEIEWTPTVAPHDTLDWDLWYSVMSAAGPWTTIAMNLPPGSNTVGIPHFYDWTVPNIVDSSVWVRVQQDNDIDINYEDFSEGSFSIVAPKLGDYDGSGTLDEGDFLEWRNTFGDSVTAGKFADGNGNGQVDAADYTVWRDAMTTGGGAGSNALAIPEPSSPVFVVIGVVFTMIARRSKTPGRAGG